MGDENFFGSKKHKPIFRKKIKICFLEKKSTSHLNMVIEFPFSRWGLALLGGAVLLTDTPRRSS